MRQEAALGSAAAAAGLKARSREVRRGFRRGERGRSVAAWILILPSVAFIAFFFIVPIVAFLTQAVDNTDLTRALPRTTAALSAWDGDGLPADDAFAALAEDLNALPNVAAQAQLARRLNHNEPGYRQLVMRTAARLPAVPEETWRAALVGLDPQWGETTVWRVLRHERQIVTPLYLLASLDFARGEDGVERVPEDRRLFVSLLVRTLVISVVVTGLCVLFGFPLAYTIASSGPRLSNWLLILVLLPFWTSLLVRTTAWIVILQREGLVNQGLQLTDLISEPLALIYNRTGVYIAMVHVLLPFLVLPLYSVMRRVDPNQLRAGAGLGGPPLTVLRTIYLPQVLPGVVAGASLVFVLSLGYYITPALVGGPGDQMIAYFIAYFTLDSVNWGMAASLSLILLAVVLVVFGLIGRTIGLDRLRIR